MKVKITSTPDGDVPQLVREGWIGLILEGLPYEGDGAYHLISKEPIGPRIGIRMPMPLALSALKNHNRRAWNWWQDWLMRSQIHPLDFVFDRKCYEVLK